MICELVQCKTWQKEPVEYPQTFLNIDRSAAQARAMNKRASSRPKQIDIL